LAEKDKTYARLQKEKEILKKQNDDMQNMFLEQIKMLMGNINKTFIDYNKLNTSFVLANFTEAHNIEDLMRPKLTNEEIKFLNEDSSIEGCFKLLKNRCIDGIEIEKRPFHLVDVARKKYLIRSNGIWLQEIGGFTIIKGLNGKLKEMWDGNLANESQDSLMSKSEKIIDFFNNSHKILEYAKDHIILKNNAKNLLGDFFNSDSKSKKNKSKNKPKLGKNKKSKSKPKSLY
jgi:Asp-tRNA(Asn)/Glu-tRNA(Gln) amidotransferase C subunit